MSKSHRLDLHNYILKPPLAFKGFNKIIDFTLEDMAFSVDGLRALLLRVGKKS